jgi:hypothetical protein
MYFSIACLLTNTPASYDEKRKEMRDACERHICPFEDKKAEEGETSLRHNGHTRIVGYGSDMRRKNIGTKKREHDQPQEYHLHPHEHIRPLLFQKRIIFVLHQKKVSQLFRKHHHILLLTPPSSRANRPLKATFISSAIAVKNKRCARCFSRPQCRMKLS